MTTLETKTPSGKPVEIRISTYCGMASLSAKVAGKRFDGQLIAKRGLPGGATHCIGQVCLSAEEAARVAEAVAAYEVADPEIAAARLRSQREAIVSRIAAAREAAEHAREQAWERADDRGGVSENEYDARAKAAHIDLAAFDAEHPEVVARVEAEKKAAVERNLWN